MKPGVTASVPQRTRKEPSAAKRGSHRQPCPHQHQHQHQHQHLPPASTRCHSLSLTLTVTLVLLYSTCRAPHAFAEHASSRRQSTHSPTRRLADGGLGISSSTGAGDGAANVGTRASELFELWSEDYQIEAKAKRALRLRQGPLPSASPGSGKAEEAGCFPEAPHLLRCDALTAARQASEQRGPNGELPMWAVPSETPPPSPSVTSPSDSWDSSRGSREATAAAAAAGVADAGGGSVMEHPWPPWVRGGSRDNLAMTHQAQTDIWADQFPPHNCMPVPPPHGGQPQQQEQQQQPLPQQRFLLSWWEGARWQGLGSHIHLMSEVLALAMVHQRVFVPMTGTFERADHDGCTGEDAKSFSCYFFRPTSRECEAQAMNIFNRRGSNVVRLTSAKKAHTQHQLHRVLASNATVVVISLRIYASQSRGGGGRTIPPWWGQPWTQHSPKEILGVDGTIEEYPYLKDMMQVNWWRSQASRFLLRWPSAYLCHLLNFARHQTYGMHVAAGVAAGVDTNAASTAQATPSAGETLSVTSAAVQAAAAAKGLPRCLPQTKCGSCPQASSLSWSNSKSSNVLKLDAAVAATGCDRSSRGKHCEGASEISLGETLNPRAFIPRPIVRVHVRGSDKKAEMKVFPLGDYIHAAEAFRHVSLPNASFVWLSSEEKAIFEAAEHVTGWHMYSLDMESKWDYHNKHMHTPTQWGYLQQAGMRDVVEASWLNLLVSVEADAFVFTLRSNWDRLGNELRLTNGRLWAPVSSLNLGEY